MQLPLDALASDPSKLPPELLEAMLEQYRRKLKEDYLSWCQHCLAPSGQVPGAHHRLIIEKMQAMADGKNTRNLMICAPPGSAKSTYTSVLFPVWFLGRKRNLDLVQVSFAQDMAERMARSARDLLLEHGPLLGVELMSDNASIGSWRFKNGSRYYAVGAGGALTGRRADIILMDDIVKDAAQAESEGEREKLWDWYYSVASTRGKPDRPLGMVLVMTRWNRDDIAGRLLETDPDGWEVLRFTAIAEEDDVLGREVGEPLWNDTPYGAKLLARRDELYRVGSARFWSAMYQQNPVPTEGALFQTAKIGVVDAIPAGARMVRAWDLAATKQLGSRDPDWTVGVLLAEAGGTFCVVDVVRTREGPEGVERTIVATAQRDGPKVRIGLPQDPGQAGVQQVAYLTRKLAGFVVESSRETGSKDTRAAPVAAQCNVGNLVVLRGAWNRVFLDELRDFPAGVKDDQVDALSRAFSMVSVPLAKPARTLRLNWMGR